MNPYIFVKEATNNGESLLSLCSGIGLELNNLNTQDVTAVDVFQQYLNQVHHRCPHAKTILSEATEYIKNAKTDSVDVISFIDGLEHLSKKDGRMCLEECKRVARKKVLVFTQIGYLRNEPHNAWGIEGGDSYQTHKSGWEVAEVEGLGYRLISQWNDTSQHGEPYTAVMYEWTPNV